MQNSHHQILELVFLMVILKIPIAYLCYVVWYAIRAKPEPHAGAGVTVQVGPDDLGPTRVRRTHRFRPRPHGGPSRSYPRRPRTAVARARR